MDQILGAFLQKRLGSFFKDFSKNQLKFKFSLGSGSTQVILRDLEVDEGYLQTLIPGLPFEISRSTVDYVKITVSIAHINTQPMEIEIGNLILEVREPVEIFPYKDLKSESFGSLGGMHKGVPKGQTMADMNVKEGPGGPYVKAKKKSYTTVQKVWHGASWNIKRVQVMLYTLGQDKSEGVEEELRPPALEILLEDIKFHSTDEHWRKCNLKESREYSSEMPEQTYLFKETTCKLSINVIPSNTWFPTASVVDSHRVRFRFVNLFEPIWINPKGEEVALDKEVSYDILSEEMMRVDLDGQQMLQLADCVKGLNSALSRSDIPPNPYQYGSVNEGAVNMINVVVPEILFNVHLLGEKEEEGNGLGLRMSGISAGFMMGPEDFRFTTQLSLGTLALFDLANPKKTFVHGPNRVNAKDRLFEVMLEPTSIHPLKVDPMGNRVNDAVSKNPLFVLKQTGCNPMFSDFRPDSQVQELELYCILYPLHIMVDPTVADHAVSIQTLINIGLQLSNSSGMSLNQAAAAASSTASVSGKAFAPSGAITIQPPSALTMRSNIKMSILAPVFEIKVPCLGASKVGGLSLRMNALNIAAFGYNEAVGGLVNSIEVQVTVGDAGLYSDDPSFSIPGAGVCSAASDDGSMHFPIARIENVILNSSLAIEAGGAPNSGHVRSITSKAEVRSVMISVHSEQPKTLLAGIAAAYTSGLSALHAAADEFKSLDKSTARQVGALGQQGQGSSSSATINRQGQQQQSLVSVDAKVDRVGVLIGAGDSGASDSETDGSRCISLELCDCSSNFNVLGSDVISLDISIPVIRLSSKGSPILSIDAGGLDFLHVSLERQGVSDIKARRELDAEAPWALARVALRGVKLEVSEGVVSDVSRLVEDLSGVKNVGQDLGMIAMSLYQVARLNTKPDEGTAKASRFDRAVQIMKEKRAKVSEGPLMKLQKRMHEFESELDVSHKQRRNSNVVDLSPESKSQGLQNAQTSQVWSDAVTEFAEYILVGVPSQLSVSCHDWQVSIVGFEEMLSNANGAATASFSLLSCTRHPQTCPGVSCASDGITIQLVGLKLRDANESAQNGPGHLISALKPFGAKVKLEWDEIQSTQGFKPRFEVEGDRFELLLQSSIMLTLLTVGLEYRGVKRARDGEVEKHAVLMSPSTIGAMVPEARSAPRSSGVGLEQELTRGGGDLVFEQDSSGTLSQRWERVLQREAALEVGMRKLKLMEAQEQKRASSALSSGRQGKEATSDVVANLAMHSENALVLIDAIGDVLTRGSSPSMALEIIDDARIQAEAAAKMGRELQRIIVKN